MRRNSEIRTKDLTYIAIGISALVVGGLIVYQVSAMIGFPGVKYILLAPYLSMVIYVLMSKIEVRHPAFLIGTTFGLVMILFNVFMTIAIISTAILTELSIQGIHVFRKKCVFGAVLFSGYTGMTALLVSKYFIGGVFERLTLNWIGVTAIICLMFGYIGAMLGQRILTYLHVYHYSNH